MIMFDICCILGKRSSDGACAHLANMYGPVGAAPAVCIPKHANARKALGAFVTIYAFLITFWGAAWVFFIIGWISVGGRQAYFIEVCDQVLTALFAVMGDGKRHNGFE